MEMISHYLGFGVPYGNTCLIYLFLILSFTPVPGLSGHVFGNAFFVNENFDLKFPVSLNTIWKEVLYSGEMDQRTEDTYSNISVNIKDIYNLDKGHRCIASFHRLLQDTTLL